MIRNLKETIFILVAIFGLSIAASAQKRPQKPPPKEKPPVVKPGKPEQKPKKPKKPSMSFMFAYAPKPESDRA